MPERPIVSVAKHAGDEVDTIARAVSLAGLTHVFGPGQRVTIKPNWHGGKGFTSPAVVIAMARYVRDQGAREIIVGDGTFYSKTNESFAAYIDEMNVREPLRHLGARVANFHEEPFVIRRDLSPDLPTETGISVHAVECDVLVNLPLMKTHFGTLVTFGIKNLKGCLRPEDKAALHKMELHAALVALNDLVRPTLNVMDAITAFEGLGPGNATPVPLGLVLCSGNVVALDAAAAYLIGLEPSQVKLIAMAAKAGLGPARLDEIEVRGERLDDHRRRFELPFEAFQKNHPNLRVCHEHACSGCMGNFFSALAFLGKPARQDYPAICLGHGEPPAPGSLLIGDCACRDTDGFPAIPGCPPNISDIMRAMASQEG